MKAGFVAAVCAALIASGCRTGSRDGETGFLNRTVRIGAATHPYVVFVPAAWEPARRWPVVLFLHGAGERGSDGWRQTAVGLGAAIRRNADVFAEVIVVFPQAPEGTAWMGEPVAAAMGALEATVREFSGDRDRLYLTGLSLGGYGSWYLATTHPERFAAIVPICGGIVKPPTAANVRDHPLAAASETPYAAVAAAVPDVPIWIFHGADDPVIPVSESRRMARALEAAGREIRYTEYPGVGHNAWDPAYADPELWSWFLAQRRTREGTR